MSTWSNFAPGRLRRSSRCKLFTSFSAGLYASIDKWTLQHSDFRSVLDTSFHSVEMFTWRVRDSFENYNSRVKNQDLILSVSKTLPLTSLEPRKQRLLYARGTLEDLFLVEVKTMHPQKRLEWIHEQLRNRSSKRRLSLGNESGLDVFFYTSWARQPRTEYRLWECSENKALCGTMTPSIYSIQSIPRQFMDFLQRKYNSAFFEGNTSLIRNDLLCKLQDRETHIETIHISNQKRYGFFRTIQFNVFVRKHSAALNGKIHSGLVTRNTKTRTYLTRSLPSRKEKEEIVLRGLEPSEDSGFSTGPRLLGLNLVFNADSVPPQA